MTKENKDKIIDRVIDFLHNKPLKSDMRIAASLIEELKLVKNCSIPDVMLSLPSQEEIDEQIDKYAFRVPYDGSNNFYDEVALKHYKAGIEWLLSRIQGNGAQLLAI